MAQQEASPQKSPTAGRWIIIVIILGIILFFILRGCSSDKPQPVADTTDGKTPIAVTAPDTAVIDFKSPAIANADIKDPAVVMTGNADYTIYSLGENILFGKGDTALLGGADAKLQQVAASLNKRFVTGKVRVYGSTDNTGESADNKALGKARAVAVKRWLVNYGKVDASRISVNSFGENEPVASNATEEGQAKNRNVSIVAFPNK